MKGLGKSVAMLCFGVFFLVVLGFGDAPAAVLVNDTFEIPAGTSTRADDASDPQDAAWYAVVGTAAYLHAANDTVTGSRALMFEGGSPTAVCEFPNVELANIGDYIRLNLNVRYDRLYGDENAGYSVNCGLYDSGTTHVDGDGQQSKIGDDKGYFGLLEMNQVGGDMVPLANGYAAIKQENPAGTVILSSFSVELGNVPSVSINVINDDNDTYAHSIAMTLTRIEGGISIEYAIDGTRFMLSHDTTATAVYNFNEIAIRQFAHGDTYFDNIKITKGSLTPTTCEEALEIGLGMTADFNNDCVVDFIDFTKFAEQWLDCMDPQIGGCS